MPQNNLFDSSAKEYDKQFTHTVIGMKQRQIVWNYLNKTLFYGMNILEINCGTGEDAIFLARLGFQVTATDASGEMIARCEKKSSALSEKRKPLFQKAAFTELPEVVGKKKFDMLFSNFSGLNCLDPDELKSTSPILGSFLNPGGRLIIVVFGKKCMWEKIYMLLSGRIRDINRRSSKKPVTANLSGYEIPVFYYSESELKQIFKNDFEYISKKPVGLFIPPSYLNTFFRNKQFLLRLLSMAERMFGSLSFLSGFADHYVIEFKKA